MYFKKPTLLSVCLWLVIIGALNWGVMAASEKDAVKPLLGAIPLVQGYADVASNVVYALIASAGVVLLADKAKLL